MDNGVYIKNCPITNSNKFITYLDLGPMPIVNNLCNTKEESINCERFPLAVNYFEESSLSMLSYSVNKDILYKQYTYKSGVSLPYIEHCKEMYSFVNTYLNLGDSHKVLDIGGNDGTLLNTFRSINPNLNLTNVDASENICKDSESKGIRTINGFWGVDMARSINEKFRLITSTNVFQHTLPISDFVEAVSMSLDKFGIWCLEFPYWKNTLETKQFDQVYHEHVYYYLVKPLSLLLDKHGLRIIKVVSRDIHGGSARLLISHKGEIGEAFQSCTSVTKWINEECMDINYYIQWGKDINKHINNCREFILDLKAKGNSISGFGAAAKGCIFLNSAGLDHTTIDYVIDDTDLKQGKYIPGTGIQIISREQAKSQPTNYMIILAHNFSDYIIRSLGKYKGKYIILMPNIQVI